MKKTKNENLTGRLIGLPLLSVLFPLVFFLFSANSYVGEMADFSGKWKLNEDQSEIAEGRYGPSITLIVTQTESSLIVDRTRIGREGQERKIKDEYNLNGEEKITESERGTTKTKASWSADGKTLTIHSHRKMTRNDQTFEITSKETWELSDDGSTLTIKTSSSSPRGERNYVLVYDKSN
jgi:hypothetical protein